MFTYLFHFWVELCKITTLMKMTYVNFGNKLDFLRVCSCQQLAAHNYTPLQICLGAINSLLCYVTSPWAVTLSWQHSYISTFYIEPVTLVN